MTNDVSHGAESAAAGRVRASFGRQGLMAHLGARLDEVRPGFVRIVLPFRPELSQQHGFFHAGATSAIADSAAGYAGYSVFPPDASVLSVEFKINLVAPAQGERLEAEGHVVKAGRTLTICRFEVFGVTGAARRLVAVGQQTLMARTDMPGGPA